MHGERKGHAGPLDRWQSELLRRIRERPGVNLRELQGATGFAWSVVSQKVGALEAAGLVSSTRIHTERRVFGRETRARDRETIALLRWGRSRLIIDHILADPGVFQANLLSRVRMPRNNFRALANQLVKHRLIAEERRGIRKYYYPGERLGNILAKIERYEYEATR